MGEKKNLLKYLLEVILFIVLFALMDNMNGVLKYMIVMGVCAVLVLLSRKREWSLQILVCIAIPAVVYVILGSICALVSVYFQKTTIKVILYWIVPLIFSFGLYVYCGKNMERVVHAQFVGACLAYALFDVPYFAKIVQWESIYAFVFGIFAVYYAYKKRWGNFVIAVLFTFFAEKRIALLAMFAALFVMGIMYLFRKSMKLAMILWGMIICGIYGYMSLIYSGFVERFCWGANINTNGRVEIYSRMANEFDFSLKYFGNGLGVVEHLLKCWNISTFSNLHNDLLKIYIELGFCGLFLFLASYGLVYYLTNKWIGKDSMCFILGMNVYSIILFATDNVSIYMIYLIPMYSTFFSVLANDKTGKGMEVDT